MVEAVIKEENFEDYCARVWGDKPANDVLKPFIDQCNATGQFFKDGAYERLYQVTPQNFPEFYRAYEMIGKNLGIEELPVFLITNRFIKNAAYAHAKPEEELLLGGKAYSEAVLVTARLNDQAAQMGHLLGAVSHELGHKLQYDSGKMEELKKVLVYRDKLKRLKPQLSEERYERIKTAIDIFEGRISRPLELDADVSGKKGVESAALFAESLRLADKKEQQTSSTHHVVLNKQNKEFEILSEDSINTEIHAIMPKDDKRLTYIDSKKRVDPRKPWQNSGYKRVVQDDDNTWSSRLSSTHPDTDFRIREVLRQEDQKDPSKSR